MTAKQILDAFSETLMQDERILSGRERELLMSLLQNSRLSNNDPQTQSAVAAVMARSVGETVAQRAFGLLGGSIVDQILAGIQAGTEENISATQIQSKAPQPPMKGPPSPAPSPGPAPQPPHISSSVPYSATAGTPQPPMKSPPTPAPAPGPAPQPPHGIRPESMPVRANSGNGVGVLELPVITRAQSVVLDEFLSPPELEELRAYALQHEADFQISQVLSPNDEPGTADYDHRRSRVLMDLGKHQETILKRIRAVLPRVLDQLDMEEFPVTNMEAQITASNNGDFFRAHTDDGQKEVASRRLTFVYFFHREPRQFEGGELRLHDSRGGLQTGSYQTIEPRQNQIVFFPCSLTHEITPVECPSQAFADSRFTLNGWLHK